MGSVSDFIQVKIYKDFRPRMYRCKLCGKEFYTRSGARSHVKKKHIDKLKRLWDCEDRAMEEKI
jgi:hypothetical protein